MSFSSVDWTLAGGIIITGLVVVFFVLAFLWFFIATMGKVCTKFLASIKKNEAVPQNTTPVQQPSAPKLNGELVAVITAAVSSVTEKNFKIKSIALKGDNTPLWKSEN